MLTSVVRLPRDPAVRRQYPGEISELRGGFNRHVNAPGPLLVHPRGRTWNRRQEWRLDSLQRLSCRSKRRPRPGELSCVRDGLQRPGSGQVSVLRTEILGAAQTSPTPPHRPDHPCDLRQRLWREHGAHLTVTRLVPPDIRDGPELPKELGVITVDGERSTVEPFDLTVPNGDDGEPFGVGPDSEAIWLGQRMELPSSALLLRELSPTRSGDPRIAAHAPGDQRRACQALVRATPSRKSRATKCCARQKGDQRRCPRRARVRCFAAHRCNLQRFGSGAARGAGEAAGRSSVRSHA
jgi:hypothetical protein